MKSVLTFVDWTTGTSWCLSCSCSALCFNCSGSFSTSLLFQDPRRRGLLKWSPLIGIYIRRLYRWPRTGGGGRRSRGIHLRTHLDHPIFLVFIFLWGGGGGVNIPSTFFLFRGEGWCNSLPSNGLKLLFPQLFPFLFANLEKSSLFLLTSVPDL